MLSVNISIARGSTITFRTSPTHRITQALTSELPYKLIGKNIFESAPVEGRPSSIAAFSTCRAPLRRQVCLGEGCGNSVSRCPLPSLFSPFFHLLIYSEGQVRRSACITVTSPNATQGGLWRCITRSSSQFTCARRAGHGFGGGQTPLVGHQNGVVYETDEDASEPSLVIEAHSPFLHSALDKARESDCLGTEQTEVEQAEGIQGSLSGEV